MSDWTTPGGSAPSPGPDRDPDPTAGPAPSPAPAPAPSWGATPGPGRPLFAIGGLASALRVLLLVAAVLSAALAFLAVRMRSQLEDADRDALLGHADARDAVQAFFGGLSVYLLALLAIGVLFVIWMWRLAKNNQSLGRPGALGPGWAIGGWFIPFGSLVIPAVQLQQIWQGADAGVPRGAPDWRQVPRSPQLWLWWVTYVVGQLLTFVAFNLINPTEDAGDEISVTLLLNHLDDIRLGVTLFVVGQLLMIVAAALGAAVVVRLTRRQEAATMMLGPAATGLGQPYGSPWPVTPPPPAGRRPVSPPAWHPDPTGRFDHRYWDGHQWTEHVSRGGKLVEDPL